MESCNGIGAADVSGRATHLPSFSLSCVDELKEEEADRCGRATPLPSEFSSAEDEFYVVAELEDGDAEGSGCATPLPPDSLSLPNVNNISQHPFFKSLLDISSRCKGSRMLFEYDLENTLEFYELPKSPHHWVCKMGIFTVNFCNEMHIDRNDHRSRAKMSMLQELQSVFECDTLKQSAITEQARALYELVNEFNAPQPMTCCYQFVPSQTKVEDTSNIQVHCYFPMSTLGVAHRVFDHWTNNFLGGVILHGTSVPIFYEHSDDGEEIFVGEHPRMNLVAWGEG
jgi:hypothetical protein